MSLKEQLLYKSYDIINQMTWYNYSLSEADKYVDDDLMGYGTNLDEKMLGISSFLKLIKLQREQGEGIEIQLNSKPVIRKIFSNGNAALFVDEITMILNIESKRTELLLRISWVFEYQIDKWRLIHWHGSISVSARRRYLVKR